MIASDGSKTLALEDVAPTECPTSILFRFPQIEHLAKQVDEAVRMQKFIGTFPYGLNDCGKWPARWYDAVKLARIEDNRLANEKDKRK